MSEVVALQGYMGDGAEGSDERIEWLAETILRNRFLPAPPAENVFVGDGDFRLIGTEFLRHFVRLGGLRPEHRVLDIGSGIGRMAVPLTQYLDPEVARYEGIDPVREGVDWCSETISPVYPNFRFRHLDIAHDVYNPAGRIKGEELRLPFDDAAFDFILMVSVATHLPAVEIGSYTREIARVLAPGGRLFLSAFVMDESARTQTEGRDARLGFTPAGEGPEWYANPEAPLGAVAFEDGFIDDVLQRAGLAIRRKSLGHWRGRQAAHYQDVFVAETGGEEA